MTLRANYRGSFLIAVLVSGCGKDGGTGPAPPPPPPPPPPAPTTIAWGFCDPSHTPVWFAYQDSTGVWNPVQPGGSGSYAFQLTHATGGVAWVTNQPGQGPWTEVTYGSAAELAGEGTGWCAGHPDRSKTLAVSTTGVAPGEWVNLAVGSASTTLGASDVPGFISGVPTGPLDLTAMKFGGAVVLGIVRRGIDLPNNTAIPVLDFANEAHPVPVATVTVSNAGSDLTTVNEFYLTARGGDLLYGNGFASRPAGETIYGIPPGAGLAGDLYLVRVSALRGGSAIRDAVRVVAAFGDQAIALGPDPTPPTLSTTTTTPYLRLHAAGPVQAGYGNTIVIGWQQALNPVGGSQATLTVTRAYLGTATGYDLTIPDFSGAAGWQNSWGLQAGAATFWFLNMSGVNGGIRDGYVELTAAIGGDLP